MMIKSSHQFHMVDNSPWPILAATSALSLTSGITMWFHTLNPSLLIISMMLTSMTAYQWWRDIIREGNSQGLHTTYVVSGLRLGMIMFIASEVLFFFSFFWAFFHSSLSPTAEIGVMWPPMNIEVFNPIQVPLLNTIILLASGISVTWTHHSLINGNHNQAFLSLMMTVILGAYFTALQALEYWEASFSISDSIYGSTFFVATGFHGMHVLIGTTFLLICLSRIYKNQFSTSHHFGFEAAAWYWHFVDVVWLFLYISIYWWGG